jgi:hypothetical protein
MMMEQKAGRGKHHIYTCNRGRVVLSPERISRKETNSSFCSTCMGVRYGGKRHIGRLGTREHRLTNVEGVDQRIMERISALRLDVGVCIQSNCKDWITKGKSATLSQNQGITGRWEKSPADIVRAAGHMRTWTLVSTRWTRSVSKQRSCKKDYALRSQWKTWEAKERKWLWFTPGVALAGCRYHALSIGDRRRRWPKRRSPPIAFPPSTFTPSQRERGRPPEQSFRWGCSGLWLGRTTLCETLTVDPTMDHGWCSRRDLKQANGEHELLHPPAKHCCEPADS